MCYHSQLNLCSISGCWISSPVVNESRAVTVASPEKSMEKLLEGHCGVSVELEHGGNYMNEV